MIAITTKQPDRRIRQRLLALSLVMLLPSLGTSIANVALPDLAASFAAPFPAVQWVVISYLLAVTTLIVGAGRFGDMVGRRRLLLVGIGIFALASASCAAAPNLWILIAARSVQGLGAAIMMALTVASVGDMVPKEHTGSAIGLLGTVSAVGTALGPSLGGVLISWFSWPAVFVFMAGAGAVALLVGHRVFPVDAPVERHPSSFDVLGTLLLGVSLGAFALSTTLISTAPGAVIASLVGASAISLVAFVAHEAQTPAPLVHLELLRNRTLGAGLISMGLVSVIMMATLVVGPFYLSKVLGLGPVQTGLMMSIGPAVAALTGLPAGRLVDHLGASIVTITGLAGVMAGSVLMTALPNLLGVSGYICALAMITAGYALYQVGNNTTVMNSAAKDRRGITSALLGLSRNMGLITGASAMGALFALGSRIEIFGRSAGGETGLQLTFAVAVGFAGLALGIAMWGGRKGAPR